MSSLIFLLVIFAYICVVWMLVWPRITRDARFESTFWDEPRSSATGLYVEKFIDRTGLTYGVDGAPACPPQYASCTNENGYPCVRYSETAATACYCASPRDGLR